MAHECFSRISSFVSSGVQWQIARCRRSRYPRRRFGLRRILFQVGELKLELLEQRATLRGLAEPLVP